MGTDFAVFALLVLAFALLARRLSRWYVTAPIAFVTAGMLLGLVLDTPLPPGAVLTLGESTLALLLFHDAAQVRPRQIGRERGLVLRLLLFGLPLTIVLGFVAASGLLPDLAWPMALLLAAALAPTDAGLGAATVLNPVVPVRIRRVLNVESGLNDGLATPVVLFAIAAATAVAEPDSRGAVVGALSQILIGMTVGAVAGAGGGLLMTRSRERGWSTRESLSIGALALPLGAYTLAGLAGGNGFIAAFIAGTTFAATTPWITDETTPLRLTEALADVLGFLVWFIFGLVLTETVGGISWRGIAFAALSLTVLRMGPVWLSLVGSGLKLPTVAFVGWFGPRGLASLVFALIAVEELPPGEQLDTVLSVIAATVVGSVILHGVTADPLATRFGAWVQRTRPAAELADSVEPVTRNRLHSPRTGA